MNTILQVEGLCKSYPSTHFNLKDVTFSVPTGSVVGLVGANGTGKSTIIKCILGICTHDAGRVVLFGQEMTDADASLRNDVGVVFDSSCFSPELTAQKVEKVMSDAYSNWDSALYFEYLEAFKLPRAAKIKTFSRGMSMKLSIAVALSHQAKLLILDEATAGLDPLAREEILDLILDFMEDEDHAVLMSSHISTDLEKVADYIAFLHNETIALVENKDTLLYEYGIARLRKNEFEKMDACEYEAFRVRGMQIDVLVSDRAAFCRKHPDALVDAPTVDEVFALIAGKE